MDKDNRLCNKCGLLPQTGAKPQPVCKPKCKRKCKEDCCDDGFSFRKVVIPAALGDDITGKDKPSNGAYTNAYVEYEANGAQYMYDSYGIYTKMEDGAEGTLDFNELENRPKYAGVEMTNETDIPDFSSSISGEREARIEADSGLQSQIDALSAASDVTDIVGTYADLQAYDTSKLKDNDIIKVLQDETHDDETTYYRWSTTTHTFTLIGEEGPYYTKSAADTKFQDKLTAGTNITIDADNVISASAGGSETIFYANSQETGNTRHIYKDAAFTEAASAQDLLDANEEGPVILRITIYPNTDGVYSDAYIQNTYVGIGDYQFLFLDEKTYREYAATATSDTAFYYSSSIIQTQLTAGSNIQINGNTISATDTTYSDFVGTDGTAVGTAGLVPAPATTDAGKYLKADGTWDNVSGGIPTTATFWGQSYDAVNDKVDGAMSIKVESYGTTLGIRPLDNYQHVAELASVSGNGVAICDSATSGNGIQFDTSNSYAFKMIGSGGSNHLGINMVGRNIANLASPTNGSDAANKSYVDQVVIDYSAISGNAAPTTSTSAKYIGQLYYDTTNDDMYYCSAITAQGTTPETYTYTWNTIGGGGSGGGILLTNSEFNNIWENA